MIQDPCWADWLLWCTQCTEDRFVLKLQCYEQALASTPLLLLVDGQLQREDLPGPLWPSYGKVIACGRFGTVSS